MSNNNIPDDEIFNMLKSNNNFGKNIQKNIKQKDTHLLNVYDRINKNQAMDIIGGTALSSSEVSNVLNDPRMRKWMQDNNMDTSPASMESYIENRMLPNVRKITQNDPTETSNIRMKQFIGEDTTWRPKNAVEKNLFVTPEETKSPEAIRQSGKSLATYDTLHSYEEKFYQNNISQRMNGIQPEQTVNVQNRTNSHYGGVTQEQLSKYDPGQTRTQTLYQDNSNLDMSSTRPNTSQTVLQYPEMIQKNEKIEKSTFTTNIHEQPKKNFTLYDMTRKNSDHLEVTNTMNYHTLELPMNIKRIEKLSTYDLKERQDLENSRIKDHSTELNIYTAHKLYKNAQDAHEIGESTKLDKKVSEDASVQYIQNRNAYMSIDTAKSLFGNTLTTNIPNQNYSDLQNNSTTVRGKYYDDSENTRNEERIIYENVSNSVAHNSHMTRQNVSFEQTNLERKQLLPNLEQHGAKKGILLNNYVTNQNTNKKSESRQIIESQSLGNLHNSIGRHIASYEVTNDPTIHIQVNEKPNTRGSMNINKTGTTSVGFIDSNIKNKLQERVPLGKNKLNIQLI